MEKRQFRCDARPLSGKLAKYVAPQTAYEHLTDTQGNAEAARLRMLQRMGLNDKSGSATDARERMIHRRECRGQ